MSQKYTEARKQGNRKWDAANLDRVSLAMPKGEKAVVKAHADAAGESVNAYILRAVHNAMEPGNDAQGGAESAQGPESRPVLLAQAVDVERVKAHAEKMEESIEVFLSRAVDGQIVRDETALRLKNLK